MSYYLEKLSDEIDHNFGNILSIIIIGYYSKYTFDSDAQTKRLNNFVGFSSKINRKHRLKNIDHQEEINIKKFYLLTQSCFESSCYDIHNYLRKTFNFKTKDSDFLKNIFKHDEVQKYFNNISLEYTPPRYINIANFIWLSANVVKHTSGIIKNEKSGSELITKYGLEEDQHVCCTFTTLNIIANKEKIFANSPEHLLYIFACMTYIFFKDILYMISKDLQFKISNLDISQITNQLVEIELQDNIGDILVGNLENGAILGVTQDPIRKLSDKNINDYIDIKIKILEDLYAQNPDYLVQYECENNPQPLPFQINENFMVQLKNLFKPYQLKSHCTLNYCSESDLIDFLKNMINLHEEDIVMQMYHNDYQGLNNLSIAKYIIDFYKSISALEKKQKAKIVRSFGSKPFFKWSPFLFMQNRFIFSNINKT
jgi:hypothetical protein